MMGTRADFYVGRGEDAEWLGSIAYDGYPDGGHPETLTGVNTEDEYRQLVSEMLNELGHATLPEQGWPWPWENSCTTDYAYAFENDRVYVACFGHGWWVEGWVETNDRPEDVFDLPEIDNFPNMKERQNVARGGRSGMLMVGIPKSEQNDGVFGDEG